MWTMLFGSPIEPSLAERFRHWLLALYCEQVGHAWEDHSYAGPDSGCIDLNCVRCGESYHHTLY